MRVLSGQKGEVKLLEVRQPLSRVGKRARRGRQGQDTALGATLLKMNAQSDRYEDNQERGTGGWLRSKEKGSLMKDSRLSRALCFVCPPVPSAEPDAQPMVHYLLNEGMDGGVEGKTHMDFFFNTNQETSRAAFYV